MGHYRSEMVSDKEIEEEQDRIKARRLRIVNRIRTEIESRGIEDVLADIIEGDTLQYKL